MQEQRESEPARKLVSLLSDIRVAVAAARTQLPRDSPVHDALEAAERAAAQATGLLEQLEPPPGR